MKYSGIFTSNNGTRYRVSIQTGGDSAERTIFGGDQWGEDGTDADDALFFADSPVSIESEADDITDVLLTRSCTITLLARNWHADLFSQDYRQTTVKVERLRDTGADILFLGFAEPLTYSQKYEDVWDEIQINCVDCLSATQYAAYRDIGTAAGDYTAIKQNAAQRTFLAILGDLLPTGVQGHAAHIWYDGTKGVTAERRHTLFSDLTLNELLLLGDDESDVWEGQDIITEMLRYLDLHITQQGADYYIFSWESVRRGTAITFADIADTTRTKTITPETVTLASDMIADSDTSIEVGETFNRIKAKADLKKSDDLVTSPLDTDNAETPYANKKLYMEEYRAEGEGKYAKAAFHNLVTQGYDDNDDYGKASRYQYFALPKYPKDWDFPTTRQGTGQCSDIMLAATYPFSAMLLAWGKTDNLADRKSSKVQNTLNDDTALVISVCGTGEGTEARADAIQAQLRTAYNAGGVAVYNGKVSGGAFSPADGDTINYIVISGNILLMPACVMSGGKNSGQYSVPPSYVRNDSARTGSTVKSTKNDDGCYRAQTWYNDNGTRYESAGLLLPYEDYEAQKALPFNYNANHEACDTVDKVQILECELKIGDKYCVELFSAATTDQGKQKQKSEYHWYTLEQCPTQSDGTRKTTFTIGIDPDLGDSIIGQEHEVQNTISFKDNIDAKGTAIPILYSDHLTGAVSFRILGPVNNTWQDVTRRHPTMFRHTAWTDNSVCLLDMVSAIFIKDFSVKVYSNNGLVNNGDDNDIIYQSDTDETYANEKEETFKINSALTTDECRALGVTNSVNISNPVSTVTNAPLLTLANAVKGETCKPEQDWVDSQYYALHSPKLTLELTLRAGGAPLSPFNLYTHPTLGKTFHVLGMNHDTEEDSTTLKLREI